MAVTLAQIRREIVKARKRGTLVAIDPDTLERLISRPNKVSLTIEDDRADERLLASRRKQATAPWEEVKRRAGR